MTKIPLVCCNNPVENGQKGNVMFVSCSGQVWKFSDKFWKISAAFKFAQLPGLRLKLRVTFVPVQGSLRKFCLVLELIVSSNVYNLLKIQSCLFDILIGQKVKIYVQIWVPVSFLTLVVCSTIELQKTQGERGYRFWLTSCILVIHHQHTKRFDMLFYFGIIGGRSLHRWRLLQQTWRHPLFRGRRRRRRVARSPARQTPQHFKPGSSGRPSEFPKPIPSGIHSFLREPAP